MFCTPTPILYFKPCANALSGNKAGIPIHFGFFLSVSLPFWVDWVHFPSLVASNYTPQLLRGKNWNERSDTSLITESCTPAYKWPVAHTNYLTRLCTKRGCYRSRYRAPGCLSATFWGKTGHYAMQLKPVLPKSFPGKTTMWLKPVLLKEH